MKSGAAAEGEGCLSFLGHFKMGNLFQQQFTWNMEVVVLVLHIFILSHELSCITYSILSDKLSKSVVLHISILSGGLICIIACSLGFFIHSLILIPSVAFEIQ